MREIEFRGRSLESGRWVFGDLLHVGGEGPAISYRGELVDPDTVEMNTGVGDWTGKKIFEGDILRTISGYEGKVVYEESEARYVIQMDRSRIELTEKNVSRYMFTVQ